MDKMDLIDLLDEMLKPMGFKKRGNNWSSETDEVIRIVNLQRSQFGNFYYLNYGYIVKSLPLNDWKTHVEHRLGSSDKLRNKRIMDLLGFDCDIPRDERLMELREHISEQIIEEMRSVETEKDVLRVLKAMPYLYTIPPFVLRHFNIQWNEN